MLVVGPPQGGVPTGAFWGRTDVGFTLGLGYSDVTPGSCGVWATCAERHRARARMGLWIRVTGMWVFARDVFWIKEGLEKRMEMHH